MTAVVAAASGVWLRDAGQVLRPPVDGLPHLRHDRAAELSLEPGHVVLGDGRIAGFAPAPSAGLHIDARGCAVLPGFVDCHTHLPFAGWRAEEYERKLTGVPYAEIARAGGGIAASARALAETDDAGVLAQARTLARELLEHGTTALEGKTGYGLSTAGEERAARLGRMLGGQITQSFTLTGLFAHAVPAGMSADAWMDRAAALARACDIDALDIFVESVAFTNAHLERMGGLARARGRPLRAHVEQFATHRSVPVALRVGARSVDHLSCLHADDVGPLGAADCAAVLLPGAELLGGEPAPPARALADAGALCALATDCNPGTSPITSMPLIIGLAVRRYGWTVREALLAATLNAAWVLERSHELGSLELGKRADVLLLDGPAEHVPYRFGHNPVAAVFVGGVPVHVRPDQAWRLSER